MFWMIPNPHSQKRITLSLESISTIPSQATASAVKMQILRQHCSNCRMPCFLNVFGTFQDIWDQPEQNPGAHIRCAAVIFLNTTNREILRSGMLRAPIVGQVSLVGYTKDWFHCRSGRKMFLSIPAPLASVHLAVDSTTLRVSEADQFKSKVSLKWEMSQMELDIFENVSIVYCSEDM